MLWVIIISFIEIRNGMPDETQIIIHRKEKIYCKAQRLDKDESCMYLKFLHYDRISIKSVGIMRYCWSACWKNTTTVLPQKAYIVTYPEYHNSSLLCWFSFTMWEFQIKMQRHHVFFSWISNGSWNEIFIKWSQVWFKLLDYHVNMLCDEHKLKR